MWKDTKVGVILLASLVLFLSSCIQQPTVQVQHNAEVIPQYELFEITFSVDKNYRLLHEVSRGIYAEFTMPDESILTVPAFEYQDFSRSLLNKKEKLNPREEILFKVRFSPEKIGGYSYVIKFYDSVLSERKTFEVTQAESDGFARSSDEDVFYFDSGTDFFPVGMNIAWHSENGTFDYDHYFEKLSANGGNFARIIMTPWSLGIQWSNGTSYGITTDYYWSYFSQENSWRLDYIIEKAKENGIYIILCFDIYGELRAESDDPREMLWEFHPYTLIISKPEDFFVDDKVTEVYKERLDYIISRWGYSQNIFSWELWNEADITDNYDQEVFYEWNDEMYDYIKEIDPYDHLITTSFANYENALDFWGEHKSDFITIHRYSPDVADEIGSVVEKHKKFNKPILVTEFGMGRTSEPEQKDPAGENLRKTIKASIDAGAAGAAMPWWWDEYINKYDLYHIFSEIK